MIELTVSEPTAIELEVVEGKIKPEVAGHVTPKYSAQTVYPAAGTVFGSVEVDAIPDPTEVKEIGSNGDHDVRRYGVARVNVPIPPGYVLPTGSLDITENADGIDVTEKASVNVNVPIPPGYIKPTGKVTINQNATGLDIAQYAEADIDVQQPDGVLLYNLNPDGNPTKAIIKGITTVGYRLGDRGGDRNTSGGRVFRDVTDLTIYDATNLDNYLFNYWMNLSTITFYTTVINLGWHSLENLPSLTTVVIHGDVRVGAPFSQIANFKNFIVDGQVLSWGNLCNGEAVAVELYDFSKCISVFTLSSVSYLPHAAGCVIRVPSALLTEWQNSTNWCDLTDVVWEGV